MQTGWVRFFKSNESMKNTYGIHKMYMLHKFHDYNIIFHALHLAYMTCTCIRTSSLQRDICSNIIN